MQENDDQVARKLMDVLVQFKRFPFRAHAHPVQGHKPHDMFVMMMVNEFEKKKPEGIKASELSERLKIKSPSVTQNITSLEAIGMVERNVDLSDRRSVRIKLTKKGHDFVAMNEQKFLASIKGLVNDLGREDSLRLTELLTRVFRYFENQANQNKPGNP